MSPIMDADHVVVISQDQTFAVQLRDYVQEQFQLTALIISPRDLVKLYCIQKPIVIFWDGRKHVPGEFRLLHWLRNHFPGCPIFAMLENHLFLSRMELYKVGINFLFYPAENHFWRDLWHHLNAVCFERGQDPPGSVQGTAYPNGKTRRSVTWTKKGETVS